MVTTIKTTDNNCGKCDRDISDDECKNLQPIAGQSIKKLQAENSNLLIFPHCLSASQDQIGDGEIFELEGNKLTTNNIMGFIGVNNTQISIRSRFAESEERDYFLHYMLGKVFNFNLFDWTHSQERDDIFDFLLYLFPYFFNRALRQGVFKNYQKREYNDAKVRGAIDINRHLRYNLPFNGKIAYRTREHSYDNYLTQLIRHTLEFIRGHKFCGGVLTHDTTTKENVTKISAATPTYRRQQREAVIKQNLKPLNHPYFHTYQKLQQICLQILRHEKIKYGNDNDQIYGILFDGAWLWEEYLATILVPLGFVHPQNKERKNGVPIFKKVKNKRNKYCFPDFYHRKKSIVADAKYKRLDKNEDNRYIGRQDLYQIISYMHILKVKRGCLIFPTAKDVKTEKSQVGELRGDGGLVEKLAVHIPQKINDWNDFGQKMSEGEESIKREIEKNSPLVTMS